MHRASPDHVGAIATRLLPGDLVRRCAKLVRLTAENSVFRRCPDIAIVGDVNTPFSYVPFHFEYMCVLHVRALAGSLTRRAAGGCLPA